MRNKRTKKRIFKKIIAQMLKFQGDLVFHDNIESLVPNNVYFNIQKKQGKNKKEHFKQKVYFSVAKLKFLKRMQLLKKCG